MAQEWPKAPGEEGVEGARATELRGKTGAGGGRSTRDLLSTNPGGSHTEQHDDDLSEQETNDES